MLQIAPSSRWRLAQGKDAPFFVSARYPFTHLATVHPSPARSEPGYVCALVSTLDAYVTESARPQYALQTD